MNTNPGVLLVFVDGLGIGPDDPAVNPVRPSVCPCLAELMAGATAVDACLGIEGLPQSATGQTALMTGVNAAQVIGRHVEGFPSPRLKEIIRGNNILTRFARAGLRATFANAYFMDELSQVLEYPLHSVTTVATLDAFGTVRMRRELEADQAVCHDLTREALRSRGYRGRLITPEDAAAHLATVAREHDFTLFEFFQTDRAGHKADVDEASRVLGKLDRFLAAIRTCTVRDGLLFLLTSDHGNIEDLSTPRHTRNPVPLVAVGPGAGSLAGRVRSLVDLAAALSDGF